MIKFYLRLHNANRNFKKQFLSIGLLLFLILHTGTKANAQCPVVNVTPVISCGGDPGGSGPCNLLTASGNADTYVWSPLAGLYTNCTHTVPYTGTNTTTVYAAPTSYTVYTVTGTITASGCSSTATARVNYTPPAPVVTPPSVNMCLGDPAVKLKVVSAPNTVQFCSGPVNIAVPDNNPAGASNSILVSGILNTCIITQMRVIINMPHTRIGDMVFVLRAPNAMIINLDYHLTATGGNGATNGFVNTVISSTGTVALSAGVNPYTGTFKADAQGTPAGGFGATGPTGMLATATNWAPLIPTGSSANGSWTLGFYDGITGDVGTLTSWCLGITYTCGGIPASPAVWSPIAGLFSDPFAVIPYVGNAVDSVWVRPVPAGVYPYQVTTQSLPVLPVAFTNPAPIAIPVGGTATAYPSNLTVSGLPATGVTIRSIVLNNISHTRSQDIDVLLQSPSGQNVILMSDVGAAAANATYTFEDIGPAMSITGVNLTGTYKPTNNGTPDNFPAPGPGVVSQPSPAISMFTGNYNGTWRLFVLDDDGTADQGVISGGYSINFDIGLPACTSPPRTVTVRVVNPVTIISHPANQALCPGSVFAVFSVSIAGSGPNSYQWQVSTDGGTNWSNANGSAYSGFTTLTLTINPVTAGMNGYLYRLLINGGTSCSVTSNVGLLTINPLPTAVITATPLIIGPTQTTTIFSTVTANPAATYAWYYNGSVLPGEVADTLLVNYGSPGDYQLKVTNVCGVGLSNIITIANSFALNVYTYPNPSGGLFQVRYHNETNNTLQRSLTVYNNQGEKIITRTFTQTIPYQKIDIDIRAHGKGLYWIELRDASGKRLAISRAVVQ
jgi:subtilisin-like proprotein convertase family protein